MPAVDWSAPPSLAPHVGFANRAMDWIVWPGDNKTYAYVDDVDYTDPSCPGSFNSSIGLYSSDDGLSGWRYHGVVLDKRTLIKIFVGIASLTGTIGPAVMLLTPQPTVGDAAECALTEAVRRPRVHGRLAPCRRLTPCCLSVQETDSVRSILDHAIALVVS